MIKRLGDICTFVGGGTPSKKNPDFFNGSIPWATVRDMNVQVIKTTEHSITPDAVQQSATNIIPQGEVVISTHVGLGKVCFLGQDTAINQDLKAVIPNGGLSRRYLYYWFVSKTDELIANGKGATVKGVTLDFVKNLKIQVMPEREQEAVSDTLDKVNRIIQLADSQVARLDQLIKSRFVEMFGDLVKNDKGWSFSPLGKVCDVRDGTHASPQYLMSGYPLMTSKNFTNGYEDFSDVKLISKEDFEEINRRSRVDVGDIVMPMIGTIGNPVIITTRREFAIKNVSLIKFVVGSPINVFVKAVLSSQYFQRVVDEKNRGNTQKFIALSDIRGFNIPLPPLALQREFAAFVEKVDKLAFAARRRRDVARQLYRAKIQEFFG